MHYYVEQWKPRPEWLALTPEDRGKVLFDVSPAIQGLVDAGIELVGYFVNHTNGNSPSDFSAISHFCGCGKYRKRNGSSGLQRRWRRQAGTSSLNR